MTCIATQGGWETAVVSSYLASSQILEFKRSLANPTQKGNIQRQVYHVTAES